jgi:hypothetical protein
MLFMNPCPGRKHLIQVKYEEIKSRWNWSPLRNCPGRFVLRGQDKSLSPAEIAGARIRFSEFRVEGAKDVVVVVRFIDGGLISYRKNDGTYLHTLNTVEGFERKLAQLGIKLEPVS